MSRLETEARSLALLKDMSQEFSSHTTSIIKILSEFDDRLARLERNIQPVYRETGNLQSKQEDLIGTLERLEYVIQYYSVTNEVEDIIRTKPANQLDLYMQCLMKLKSAIEYFSRNNPGSLEYLNVKSLYEYGREEIKKEFKTKLQRCSSPIAPIALLDLSIGDSFGPDMSDHASIRTMSEWLGEEAIDIYVDLRSDFMSKSLKSLQDYQKSKNEITSYLTCISAFHRLAVNELNLLTNIIVPDLRTQVYSQLIQESLRLITSEANNLAMKVKKSIIRHDFKSALNLFPILRHQTQRRHNFDLLFDGCQSEELAQFQGLTITFQTIISKSLEEFASYVQNDSDMKVPRDGTVHELTNNVMIFIEQLREYLDIMSSVIPVRDMQAMENTSDKNRLGFAQYLTRLLVSLGETIYRKAEGYTNLQLIYLFKLNNFHYILRRLKESDLLDIVHSYKENVRDIYEQLIMDSKNEYIKSLYPVINHLHLRDTQDTKKSIKDRFSSFNKDFQKLHRLNRAYAVPDSELRMQIREACKHEFLQYYQQFYSYYMNQDFTKNKEKYLKYSPEMLASMIEQFFEAKIE